MWIRSSAKALGLIAILSGFTGCAPKETQTPATTPAAGTKTAEPDADDAEDEPEDEESKTVTGGKKTLNIPGPFHVGDGILGTDTLVHEPAETQACFSSLQVPTDAQVGKSVEMSFSITDTINGLKIKIGKSCGANATYSNANLKLMRDGAVIKDFGRLKYGGTADVVAATEVSVMKDELDGGLTAGEYKIAVLAEDSNQNITDKNGQYEDVAFADVTLTILSGNGSFPE